MTRRLMTDSEDTRLVQKGKARLKSLDASIARGVTAADAGRVKSISEVFEILESKLKSIANAAPRPARWSLSKIR